ncbi:hypothetical protein HOL59_02025 [Candidatus Woesearchaeota archaeon]|jgi:type I restriction enzyme S subunit|nr:hypothetical protein [Candidatus Woesearchaeota archaeon]
MISKEHASLSNQIITVPSSWLNKGEYRFDASFYCGEAVKSHLIIDKYENNIESTKKYTKEIFYPGRLKRVWSNKKKGEPFFTGAQILQSYPQTNKYINPSKIKNLDSYRVKQNTLLITRSGTIGNLTIVKGVLDKKLVTEDAIRVITKKEEDIGFLYAYLKSSIGNPLIQQSVFGAVIDHIEPKHIESIKIPIIKEEIKRQISNSIKIVFQLRDDANKLIDNATNEFYKETSLEKVEFDDPKLYEYENKIWTNFDFSEKLRLDGSYYNPLNALIIKNIKNKLKNYERLGEKNKIFELPTYKRIYLKKENGVPFLSGKNLMEANFQDLKYLSKIPFGKKINEYLIHEGSILVTMRGTCGNSRLIDKSLEGYGASHNILRIFPNQNEYHSGYIYIFLWSDYGKIQIESKILGSVVDVLTPEDCSDVIIPKVNYGIQKSIGEKAKKAFELRAEASKIEEETIDLLKKEINSI